MANTLKVSTEELKNASGEFSRHRTALSNTCGQIASTVHSAQSTWKGKASASYMDRFDQMYSELKQTDDKMQDAVDELLQAAGIFESSEKQTKTMMSGLETGDSPFA